MVNSIVDKRIKNNPKRVKRAVAKCARNFTAYDFQKAVKKISVNDDCSKCGLCSKVCVSNNIKIGNTVEFLDKCEQCMVCIQLCPQNAMHHKNERNNYRYKNKDIELKEIINANDC
ncbi:MAG: 4Fe-4S binding protein [Anaerotignum sp.]